MDKIVIAPDKLKGSLTAVEFCEAVATALYRKCPGLLVEKCPLADGGDGTVEVLEYYLGGHRVNVKVQDPLLRPTQAQYLLSADRKTAFIEMSSASGLRLLCPSEYNPLITTTYGTGELIVDAVNKGVRRIILGIGGSATTDAGLGMARALGFRFFDSHGEELTGVGADLVRLHLVDDSNVLPAIKDIQFDVACDVSNLLYGHNGAAYVYGPQKGATKEEVDLLDKGLKQFNQVMEVTTGLNLQGFKGAGAAGGLGAGSVAFLNADLVSGVELIMREADFKAKIQGAGWIITGEGRLDAQTLSGKVIKGIIDVKSNQKLAVFCGSNAFEQVPDPIDYVGEILTNAKNKDDAMTYAASYLMRISDEFISNVRLNDF